VYRYDVSLYQIRFFEDYRIKQHTTLIRKRPSQLFKILLLQEYSPDGKFNVLTECTKVHLETRKFRDSNP